MRVRVLVTVDPADFRALGGDDPGLPRQPLAYPFYGGLKRQGWEVDLKRVRSDGLGKLATALAGAADLEALRDSPDIVIALGMGGGELLFLAGGRRDARRVAVVQTPRSGHLRGIKRIARDALVRRALRRSALVLFQLREQADEEPTRLRLDPKAVAAWTIGIDSRYFAPAPAFADATIRPEIRALAGRPYAITAGDQLRDEALLAAVMKESGLSFVRVSQETRVEAFWAGRPDAFCRARLPAAEMRFLYQHATCSLNLADNSWQPAGYTVALESLACGAPMIMNHGLVTRELARHGSPPPFIEIASPVRVDEARSRLRELAADLARRAALARDGRALVERELTIERCADALDAILRARWPDAAPPGRR